MSANKLSPEQDARARKNYSVLMQRLASVGNAPVAHAVGCDEATISRMKPEKFEQFTQILAVLDLKVVPTDARCFRERDIAAYLQLAKLHMEQIDGVHQLEWD
ncbi:Bacteriophage CII protein [Pseudomonas saponiphila]|uniref:Bacteriophage CII protein n=1 Tax=Pseudomonas saponiphila TaxID=556534 RepID=A0A1H4LQ94_9PSED|nr:CII family transcriptional regulator [Pseudomonas saponiphila]SEB72808.1 Bacteriophage CII protein [Pseudomonas saponiphila]